MRLGDLKLGISLSRLLLIIILILVPLSIVGIYSVARSQEAFEETIGSHFAVMSQTAAMEVSRSIHDLMSETGTIAVEPAVLEAVQTANRSYAAMDFQAFQERINKIEAAWNTPESLVIVSAILSSPASRFLQSFREVDPRILRITVTGEKGTTVAASHKTADYYQADEPYWQNIHAQGKGAVALADVLYDDVTKGHYIGIGVPILEPSSGRFLGTVDALVQVESLSTMVNRPSFGKTGKTMLVKRDGSIIFAPGVNLAMGQKAEELRAVNDIVGELRPGKSGYVLTSLTESGQTLIGYADVSLGVSSNSPWVVLVRQNAREALSPIWPVLRVSILASVLGIVAVILLAVYFSIHREQRFEDLAETGAEESVDSAKEKSSAASSVG